MIDEETPRREIPREYHREYDYRSAYSRGRKTQPVKKKRLGYFGFQLVVCSLVLVTAVVLRLVGGNLYKTVNADVSHYLNSPITKADFSAVFKRMKASLPDAKSVFSTSGTSGTSSGKSSGSSSSSQSSSSSNSGSSKTSSPSSKTSSGGTVTTKTSVAGAKLFAGALVLGSDIPAVDNTADQKLLDPPSTAILGPYLLSADPIWPVTGDITSGFGYRINPVTKKASFHTGIDIASPKDTPIKAALPGTVDSTGVSDYYGNYVVLSHGGGVMTFYGHCDKVLVKKGQTVTLGSVIALVGTTGVSTGYHLHFEIRINNKVVNPTWVLTQRA